MTDERTERERRAADELYRAYLTGFDDGKGRPADAEPDVAAIAFRGAARRLTSALTDTYHDVRRGYAAALVDAAREARQHGNEGIAEAIRRLRPSDALTSAPSGERLAARAEGSDPEPGEGRIDDALNRIATDLRKHGTKLEPEMRDVLYRNLWDLYETDATDRPPEGGDDDDFGPVDLSDEEPDHLAWRLAQRPDPDDGDVGERPEDNPAVELHGYIECRAAPGHDIGHPKSLHLADKIAARADELFREHTADLRERLERAEKSEDYNRRKWEAEIAAHARTVEREDDLRRQLREARELLGRTVSFVTAPGSMALAQDIRRYLAATHPDDPAPAPADGPSRDGFSGESPRP